MDNQHFLLLTCAAQGHINPTLELAKRIVRSGALVTFATTIAGLRRIKTLPSLEGLSYASFSDGYDDGNHPTDNLGLVMSEFKRAGTQTLAELIRTLSRDGRPVTFLIYNVLLPWAAGVARDLSIGSAFLCTQSAAALAIYHHYFNSCNGIYDGENTEPPRFVELQGLPPFAREDLPSFLHPNDSFHSVAPTIGEHIRVLENDPNPCVLLNTFHALEKEAIKGLGFAGASLFPIGPLIPSVYLDDKNPSDKSSGCDLFDSSGDYIQWLNSKPDRSVVYVSFGSLAELKRNQMEEIFHGLVASGRPFLWVIRSSGDGEADAIKDTLKEEEGLIVPWCSQVEVLNHRSVGCFVTHCGWNSTTESLAAGVPVVGYPQFSDQPTNAKMMEEVWGTGIRVKLNEEGYLDREEMKKCVEMAMGDGVKGLQMRMNAKKWRELALEAAREGGSSDANFRAFMQGQRNLLGPSH